MGIPDIPYFRKDPPMNESTGHDIFRGQTIVVKIHFNDAPKARLGDLFDKALKTFSNVISFSIDSNCEPLAEVSEVIITFEISNDGLQSIDSLSDSLKALETKHPRCTKYFLEVPKAYT